MNRVDDGLKKAFPAAPWLFQPAVPDLFALLSKALGADWLVERQTDCDGEIAIIALSATESEAVPSLVLYEKDGWTNVATVTGDTWGCDRPFDSFPQAILAMIATARAATLGFSRIARQRRPAALLNDGINVTPGQVGPARHPPLFTAITLPPALVAATHRPAR